MTDEMKPVSTQDLRAVALYLTTGGARAGSFEFDIEDGRRIRLSATEVGGPFDEALSAPSSPGDGWVMVPKAIEDRERLLDEVFTVLEGFSCADLSSRAAYAKIVEIASLPAAPSPGGDQ